ncbi:FAD-dependent oxidoreductase [Subtercola lobariae]|uniref:3-hydroxybenzoate 6-hydroxylase n=1 Tax=Subtercola lobariae TaxID=1588641 RepID=A0A917F0E4_9MICO|nr:FAD-dependent oxidoreductase [Subtercola lobariae]GGF38092.1 3-hydroxybenzoate 6-hydroxylase [Subtercola lobariae]
MALVVGEPEGVNEDSGVASQEILIVGGGIGGVAAALALCRQGRKVTVLERAPEFKEVGAGLQMAPNATRILRSWGVLDQVLEMGVQPKRLIFRDAVTGEQLTDADLRGEFAERYGAPYVVLHRSDLHAILVEAARKAGADLRTNADVVDVETRDDVARVRTSDGTVYRADVVLGIDGLTSSLRRKVSGDEVVASGYVAYRGAIPMDEALDVDDRENVVVYLGPECHMVQYPLRAGTMFNTVAVFKSPSFSRGEFVPADQQELQNAYSDCIPQVQRALLNLWKTVSWPMYDREPIDNWVDGRMLLMGDAAHPMLQYLAQGACQAIEDADAFDRISASVTDPHEWNAALAEFNSTRADRTARVQRTARTWGEAWHVNTPLPKLLRNLLFKSRKDEDTRYTDWLYGADSIST